MIPYIACTLEWEGEANVHEATYRILQAELPEKNFTALTTGEYRERCYRDAAFFQGELPFYRVKPLYISTIRLGRILGLPYTVAVRFSALLAYIGIALLLWFWLGALLLPVQRFLLSLLAAGIFPVSELARLASPDGLAVLFLLLAFWLIERKRQHLPLLWLFLLLSIAARVDYALYGLVIVTLLRFLPTFRREEWLSTGTYLGFTISVLLALLLIGPAVGNDIGWWFAFKHAGSGSGYLHLIKESLSFFNLTWMMILLFFSIIAYPLIRKFGMAEREKGMVILVLATILFRLLLFPSIQERFFVAQYLLLIVVGVGWVRRIAGEDVRGVELNVK